MRQQFGDVLRTYRLRRGLTQQQLADLSTVSVRAIRDIEIGRARRPRTDTVTLIADGLGLRGSTRDDFTSAAGPPPLELVVTPQAPPAPLGGLVGREAEATLLRESLSSAEHRLITITGPAGVGKTRLAQDVAGALHDAGQLAVTWTPRGATMATVTDRPTLLVLDDPTHPGEVTTPLHRFRHLRVLMTGRMPFNVDGEQVFALGPLAVPAPRDQIAHSPSVRLLLRHIRYVRPGFELTAANAPAIAALCGHVDGIPLALETVAAWFLVYEPDEVLSLVRADPFDVLARGRSNLAAALSATVDSLAPAERALLDRLAGFDGGWSVHDVPGLSPAMVQRLRLRGAIRAADGGRPGRFQVLDLIRVLCAGERDRQMTVV